MKQVTLNIPENQFAFFMRLVRSLDFVQVEKKQNKDPYNPEYVAKIQKSRQEYKEGKYTRVDINNLDSFLGLK